MQTVTSTSTGTFMNRGASWGGRGKLRGSPLKNTSWTKRAAYATLKAAPRATAAVASQPRKPRCRSASASAKNISFERKPFNNGTPAIAEAATIASVPVCGMCFQSPFRRRMSRVPTSCSMIPAAMKSDALNVAWLPMWNTAATFERGESKPRRKVIRPR